MSAHAMAANSAGQWRCWVLLLSFLASKVSALDPYTVITKTTGVMDAVRGSTFEIRCDVNNRPDGISQVQNIKTRWEKAGTNCTSGQDSCRTLIAQDRLPNDQQKYGLKFQASDTYFLIIKNVDENDEGMYYCQLPLTLYVKVYDFVYLRVVEPPSIDPLKTSSDRFVAIGEDVELTCAAYGRPKPLIKWTRAGNGMMPGGGYVKLTEKLSIPNIEPKYRGPYICTATNDVSQDYRTINIDMNFKPEVTANPAEVVQKIGYETRLFCHISSQPKANSVTWFVGEDEVTVANSNKYKVTSYESAFSNIISKLTIYKVTQAEIDANIRCTASSSLGSGQQNFKVKASSTVQPIPGASSSSHRILATFSVFTFTFLGLLL